MKCNELRDLSPEELVAKHDELKQEHMNLRFQHATRQLENTSAMRRVRADIARVLTVISEKEREEA
ncbi:MAG: 50S ribosomal protein L29 [Deltaproteobacteria bacterium]|nr:MAG: 50S ribosomal protein L29 [Deltaproteobacteria bacterium]